MKQLWGLTLNATVQHRVQPGAYTYTKCGTTVAETYERPRKEPRRCKECERIHHLGMDRESKTSS